MSDQWVKQAVNLKLLSEKLVEEKKQQYPMPGQIIVYCDTVKKTKRLAAVLGCVCYHREAGSRAEKGEMVRQLTEGRQQVFTATNALGLGVDAPTIRVVIHVGVVRRLRDYGQESGRAGRDGLKSEAILLRGVRYDRAGNVFNPKDLGEDVEEDMQEFITTEGCRRVVLDRAMNGRFDRIGCEEGEERCDQCQAKEAASMGEREEEEEEEEEEGMSMAGEAAGDEGELEMIEFEQEMGRRRGMAFREMELQSAEMLEISALEERLEEWKEGCQGCRAAGREGVKRLGHSIWDCCGERADTIREEVGRLKRAIRWEKFSCCFRCGIPQGLCNSFEANPDNGGWRRVRGGNCQFADVLVESVVSNWVMRASEFRGCVEGQMRDSGVEWVDRSDIEPVIKWMEKKIRWGGFESNRMCQIFCKYLVHK